MNLLAQDSFNQLSYYKFFDISEQARWNMTELGWNSLDKNQVNKDLVDLVKLIITGECTTFSATRAFMDLFAEDLDFSQWLAIWFYEETKHPHVLLKWLSCAGYTMSAQELLQARQIEPMTTSPIEMLVFNIISEISAACLYTELAKSTSEPLLKTILFKLSKDEMRHSIGFEKYCKIYLDNSQDNLKNKLICVRSLWAFLESNNFIKHPVYLLINKINNYLGKNIFVKIQANLCSRISKLVDAKFSNSDQVYKYYQEVKKTYRAKKYESH